MDLHGRLALVTDNGHGMGQEASRRLAEDDSEL